MNIMEKDPTNPAHYQFPGGIQVIDLTRNLPFTLGNVVKYVCRAGRKNSTTELEDLEKALWYLKDRIEQVKAQNPPPVTQSLKGLWTLLPDNYVVPHETGRHSIILRDGGKGNVFVYANGTVIVEREEQELAREATESRNIVLDGELKILIKKYGDKVEPYVHPRYPTDPALNLFTEKSPVCRITGCINPVPDPAQACDECRELMNQPVK